MYPLTKTHKYYIYRSIYTQLSPFFCFFVFVISWPIFAFDEQELSPYTSVCIKYMKIDAPTCTS